MMQNLLTAWRWPWIRCVECIWESVRFSMSKDMLNNFQTSHSVILLYNLFYLLSKSVDRKLVFVTLEGYGCIVLCFISNVTQSGPL